MAHDLHTDKLTGEIAMVAAGNAPIWHGLGTRTDGAMSWNECIRLAHLDWEVEKRQLMSDKGHRVDAYGTFRTDTDVFLGVVGSKYVPIQNLKMGETLDLIVNNIGGSHYDTAGVLGNGSTVWCQIKIPYDIRVGNDIMENYLMFSNTHDGSRAGQVSILNHRVVCRNTLNLAHRGATKCFRISHYPNADRKIEELINAMNTISDQVIRTNEIFNILASKQISTVELELLLEKLIPTTYNAKGKITTHGLNKKAEIVSIFEHNDGNAFAEQRGTFFNAFNAVTNYVDHHASVKGDAGITRAQSALFGAGESLKIYALMELSRMAGISKEQTSLIF